MSEKNFSLSKETTVNELVNEGLLTKDQQEVIELEDEATLLECASFDPESGRMTNDQEKLAKLTNASPAELLENIKEFANSLLELEDMSNDEIEDRLQSSTFRIPEFEKVDNS